MEKLTKSLTIEDVKKEYVISLSHSREFQWSHQDDIIPGIFQTEQTTYQ